MDFNLRDWTGYDERNPIKSHEVSRFKYTKELASQCHGFNRSHFILAADPMRIITLPCSLNVRGGLICLPIGTKKDLENLKIVSLLMKADPCPFIGRFQDFEEYVHSHPELCNQRTKISSWLQGKR